MRSSALPLVEPAVPVIVSFAACLKLEGVKTACFFPDRCGSPREMLAVISVFAKAETTPALRALQAGGEMQFLVRAALRAADETFSRILVYADSLPAYSRSSNLGKTTIINKRLLHQMGVKTACFPSPRTTNPARRDDGRFQAGRRSCFSPRSMAPRLLRPIRQPRSA